MFCKSGRAFAVQRAPKQFRWPYLRIATTVLAYATVAFCLVTTVPVVWDGRRYFAKHTPADG
jgi:hypothetical protein